MCAVQSTAGCGLLAIDKSRYCLRHTLAVAPTAERLAYEKALREGNLGAIEEKLSALIAALFAGK